ncbi:ABC transporter permease [Cohnella abietis]|uniref:Sugar ABC transporter permease n=1 Tax=Cohnella abietis TaxID=2507935 RepID=A0A3T1D3Y8_9BACL|nr:ABC transporter permease subunit [Cohnella abietis]BBI32771.1 sugar ABC transporter permease [Cohnella abietis]
MAIKREFKRNYALYLMLLPAIILVLTYSYGPMAGLVIAFEKFTPARGIFGSKWVGWQNFNYVIGLPETIHILWNTVFIALMKIIAGLIFPIFISILLNEIRTKWFKNSIQTIIYMPYFLSWIIVGGILYDMLGRDGIVNATLSYFNLPNVFFFGNDTLFPYLLVTTDLWKTFGYSTIIYLAAIVGINPTLYEAAIVDGASRWRQIFHVTLPGMAPIIVLLATLSIGSVLNAGFEQVLVLTNNNSNTLVLNSGEIIDTFVYRLGIANAQYGLATAVGLFKSFVSFILVSLSYFLAYKAINYRIF